MVVEKPTCEMKVIDANVRAASTDHDPLVKQAVASMQQEQDHD